MDKRRSDRTGISYVSSGEPEAPLVICLHGFPDTPRTWRPLTETLVDSGFRVVAPWLPGYAPSSLEGALDLAAVSRRILTLIEELSPDAPVRIVGHDWGACIVNVASALRPERFRAASVLAVPHLLTIESAMLDEPRHVPRSSYVMFFWLPFVAEWAIRARDYALLEWLWRAWSPGFDPGDDYFAEVKSCLHRSLPAPLSYYRGLHSPGRILELRSLLKSGPIAVPTLYLHGEHDGCLNIDVIEGQERHYTALFETVRLAEAGHFLHLERPSEVNQSIRAWFEAH